MANPPPSHKPILNTVKRVSLRVGRGGSSSKSDIFVTHSHGKMFKAIQKIAQDDQLTPWEFTRALWAYSKFECNSTHPTAEEEVSEATMRVALYFWGFVELSLGKARVDLSIGDYGLHNDAIVCKELGILPQDLIFSHWGNKLGHYIVKRHHFVVWVFRPTMSAEDVAIDVNFEAKTFLDGYAHVGMADEAQMLLERVWNTIRNHLDGNTELILTGHSLGGSMAAIMCCLLRQNHPTICSYAFCFGAAPCLCATLAKRYQQYMLGICVGDDVIVRLSFESIVDLKKRLFLIAKLNLDEAGLRQHGHLNGHEWEHQIMLHPPERLWPPWKQIYIRREQDTLRATKICTTSLNCPVISSRMALDHVPNTYTDVLWEYMQSCSF